MQSSSYAPVAVETRVAAASASSARPVDPATGSPPNSCSCESRVRARLSTACRAWSRIACPPAGIAVTSDCAAILPAFRRTTVCAACSSASRMTFLSNRLVHRAKQPASLAIAPGGLARRRSSRYRRPSPQARRKPRPRPRRRAAEGRAIPAEQSDRGDALDRRDAYCSPQVSPSHGENRGSSPLGSASRYLFTLIFLLFSSNFPNWVLWFGQVCSSCVLPVS